MLVGRRGASPRQRAAGCPAARCAPPASVRACQLGSILGATCLRPPARSGARRRQRGPRAARCHPGRTSREGAEALVSDGLRVSARRFRANARAALVERSRLRMPTRPGSRAKAEQSCRARLPGARCPPLRASGVAHADTARDRHRWRRGCRWPTPGSARSPPPGEGVERLAEEAQALREIGFD